MKATFQIEWPDDYGQGWMNVDNLLCVMTTPEFVGDKVSIKVKEIRLMSSEAAGVLNAARDGEGIPYEEKAQANRSVTPGGHDF